MTFSRHAALNVCPGECWDGGYQGEQEWIRSQARDLHSAASQDSRGVFNKQASHEPLPKLTEPQVS